MNRLVGFTLSLFIVYVASCGSEKYIPLTKNIPAEKVTYQDHIKPIVSNFCLNCHSGDQPSRGIDLTSYSSVKTHTEFGNLLKRINSETNPMPKTGLMPIFERETFESWAENNFREN